MVPCSQWCGEKSQDEKTDSAGIGCDGRLGNHAERQMIQTEQAIVIRPGQTPNYLKVFEPSQEFFEHDPQLKPS